jgi:hypothetical protein
MFALTILYFKFGKFLSHTEYTFSCRKIKKIIKLVTNEICEESDVDGISLHENLVGKKLKICSM